MWECECVHVSMCDKCTGKVCVVWARRASVHEMCVCVRHDMTMLDMWGLRGKIQTNCNKLFRVCCDSLRNTPSWVKQIHQNIVLFPPPPSKIIAHINRTHVHVHHTQTLSTCAQPHTLKELLMTLTVTLCQSTASASDGLAMAVTTVHDLNYICN